MLVLESKVMKNKDRRPKEVRETTNAALDPEPERGH